LNSGDRTLATFLPLLARMLVTPLAVAAAPAPIAAVPAAPEMLFTGMLQQFLMDMSAPPSPLPPPSVEKQPVRPPLRQDHEPPRQEKEDKPAPRPMVNFVAAAPVMAPIPPGPPPPTPVEKKSDSPVPVTRNPAPAPIPAPSRSPEPALVVAVRNTDVVVVAKAPEVREVIPPERHDEIPESSAPIEPVVVTRPPIKVEAPKPAAMPDQPMPEKPPVRALAIEFRPDGVHDVRVRLAEHAGEVHVSVHSADPVITQDLREGVTGLALTLTQAGYDARAWAPDQGQRQQQRREERAAKREKRAADRKFDGALEEVSR
jgi:hypothetical protein